MCWNGEKFLVELERQIPLCITDLSRLSMMENPSLRAAWQAGMNLDGSSTGFLYMDELEAKLENGHSALRLGAGHDQTLVRMLRARVGKGRTLFLQSRNQAVMLRPGKQANVHEKDGLPVLTLTKEALEELCGVLQPHAGTYALSTFPMTVELTPTTIMDRNGNVIKVIK